VGPQPSRPPDSIEQQPPGRLTASSSSPPGRHGIEQQPTRPSNGIEQQPKRPSSAGEELPKVLYVGSFGRSGSTLIGRILGETDGAVCVGETRYVWSRGLLNNVECGCGQPFRSCPLWSAVGEDAFGGWQNVDAKRLAQMDHAVLLLRTLPLHWAPYLRPRFADAIDKYVSLLTRLYAAIARVTGAKTIIDTSKDPNFAFLLTRMRGYDVRIIHLVRDSRAVAYSWTRTKRLPSPIGEQTFLDRFKPTTIAPRWLIWNAALRALSMRNYPYTRISYEGFVANPRRTLDELSEFADEQLLLNNDRLSDNRVRLGDHHMFSGNPMRADVGWVTMRVDDEWRSMMPPAQVLEVTAITWPQLRMYGYPLNRGARDGGACAPRPREQ
jgi:hypothetical protein